MSVKIVNAALRLIGGQAITSLTDGTKNANVANDLYGETLADLLRSHPWNFATKRQELSQSATAPAFGFDHAYPLPSDWIRTISVHANNAGTGVVEYRMEEVANQNCIVSSADDIYLRYVANITDPNRMPADFRRALIEALARDMAIPVASSNTLYQLHAQRADRAMARARSADSMGQFPERRPAGSWAMARRRSLPIVGDSL